MAEAFTSGGTDAPAIMIVEKGAELIGVPFARTRLTHLPVPMPR